MCVCKHEITTIAGLFQTPRLVELKEKNERAAREIEFLNFQLAEFNKAELIEGEQEKLEADQQRLQNAETIKRNLSAAYQAISEDENAIVGQMRSISSSINQVKKYTPSVAMLYERFESLLFELEDIGSELETIAEDTEYDAERITDIQTRLDVIYKLQKKHGNLKKYLCFFIKCFRKLIQIEILFCKRINDID